MCPVQILPTQAEMPQEDAQRQIELENEDPRKYPSLWTYVLTCFKIGAISFGAPTAHIAMMENEFVKRHKWISQETLLDLLSAANLVPGPNASELCYHVGYLTNGYPGLILGGLAFITPAFLTAVLMGALYKRFGALPQVESLFYILNPLVLAIVIDTTWRISKTSFKGWKQAAIFAAAVGMKFLDWNEGIILPLCGLLGVVLHHSLRNFPKKATPTALFSLTPLGLLSPLISQAGNFLDNLYVQIFLFFFKTGAVMFGSAMVLFALIEKDVTQRFGWLTLQELTDAIAVGQITPGPVTSASSFVGYLVGGFWGAFLAMTGVFLPSFIVVMITAPLLKKMRDSVVAKAFLKGVNAGVVALILFVVFVLAQNAVTDLWTGLLLLGGLGLLVKFEQPPYILVISGIVLGLLRIYFLGG